MLIKYSGFGGDGIDVKALTAINGGKRVFIYSYYYLDRLDDSFANEQMFRLPVQRQEKCAGFRRHIDRNTCVLAYLLLEEGLKQHYGITGTVSFTHNEHGKPYLQDFPDIFFNFSHSGNSVVCALADFEIGVDIQEIRPLRTGIAQRVCSEDEMRQLEASEDAGRLFYRFWTQRESYAKSLGIGVPGIFKQELPTDRFITREMESLVMTLCLGKYAASAFLETR